MSHADDVLAHPELLDGGVIDKDANLDELQLRAQGHVSELPRRFSMFSLLAFSFSIMNSWTGIVPLLITDLTLGGPSATFWTPLVACLASSLIGLGLAELASAFPSSGGQYHFAFSVTPPKHRSAVAFVTAWFNIYAYLIVVTSGTIIPAQVMGGLIQIYHPNFEIQRYQVWLIFAALLILSTVVVTLGPSLVPKTQSAFFWASLLGIVVMSTTVLAASPTKSSAHLVFADWHSSSGWSSGLSFMLSVGQSMYLFVCVDSATHLAEEIPQPGKNVPRAMMLSPVIGIVTTSIYTLAILFSSADFTAIAESPFPVYEAYLQAIGSPGAVLFFSIWLVIIYVGCILGIVTATGRLIWAFARDNGMPFSPVFRRVNQRLKVPVEANLLTCGFCLIFGCIYIVNTTAFNTFISTGILFLNVSYSIPQGVLLFRDREKTLPKRHLDLGRWGGSFCNAFSVAWMALYTILLCFPLTIPVTVVSMNYVSVVLAGGVLYISFMWFIVGKRKSFTGPDIKLEVLNAVQEAEQLQMPRNQNHPVRNEEWSKRTDNKSDIQTYSELEHVGA